jgi:hypothetical protein
MLPTLDEFDRQIYFFDQDKRKHVVNRPYLSKQCAGIGSPAGELSCDLLDSILDLATCRGMKNDTAFTVLFVKV